MLLATQSLVHSVPGRLFFSLFLTLLTFTMSLIVDNATWWADVAFGVHPDVKSHTGGLLSYGKGAIQTMSRN